MSKLQVNQIYNKDADGAPTLPAGVVITGVSTADCFKGNVTGTAATFTGAVSIGGTLTYEDVTNIDSVGIITAQTGIKVTAGGVVVTAGGVDVTAGGIDIAGGGLEVDAGVSTFKANIDAEANINANGNIVGDNSTNISGIASVTATTLYGNGAGLTSLDGDNISSGIVTSARLGGGTANATTFLNGVGQFAAAGGGGTEAYFFMGGAGQGLTSATWARVACNTAYQDSVSGCDVSTNNGRYTVQSGHAGRYYFIGQCSTFANGNDITRADVKIYKNGSVFAGAYQHVISGGSGYARHVGPQIATMDNAVVGDYYELWVVVSGTTVSLSMDGQTSKSNYFMGWKIAD